MQLVSSVFNVGWWNVLKALGLIKASFYFEKIIGPKIDCVKIHALLNERKFDLLVYFFKITMHSNHDVTLEPH
jgi:hypothetical protein